MLESAITKKIIKRMKAEGFLTIKIAGGRYQQPGISDILAIEPPDGRIWAIEVKQPGKEPTSIQERFLHEVAVHGGVSDVCRSEGDFVRLMDIQRRGQ